MYDYKKNNITEQQDKHSKYNEYDEYTELIIYHIYIYSIILIFIFVKPNVLLYLLFITYCYYYTTWHWFKGCNINFIKNDTNKIILGFIYSLYCSCVVYIIHYIFKKKYTIRYLVILSPLFYYYFIKILEKVFICNDKNTINLLRYIPADLISNIKNMPYNLLNAIDKK